MLLLRSSGLKWRPVNKTKVTKYGGSVRWAPDLLAIPVGEVGRPGAHPPLWTLPYHSGNAFHPVIAQLGHAAGFSRYDGSRTRKEDKDAVFADDIDILRR